MTAKSAIGPKGLRWRCTNLMRFMTSQVALFSSNGICSGMLQYAFVLSIDKHQL